MIKYLFILFAMFTLSFLGGCTKKTNTITPIVEPTISEYEQSEIVLPIDTGSYPDPKINVFVSVGRVVQGMNENPEKKHEWTKKSEDGIEFFESTETGYLYTYTYSDLGIRVTTPPLYDPYFFKKTDAPIFKRYKNMIYNAKGFVWNEHIGVFTKDPKKSFEEEIKENHLPSGCKMYTGIFDKQTTYFDSMIGFEAIYFEDINSETRCTTDKQFPQHEMPIVFVINPKKPSVYYKLGIQDGCAPGPCSIFGNIEFF